MKPRFFKSAADFRAWLSKNHATTSELLIGLYKKELRRGITYPEALDEALSFGWIDGVRKRINANCYTIRFTPRKRGSIWSQVNIKRVQELIASGRRSGIARFSRARQSQGAALFLRARAGKARSSVGSNLAREPKGVIVFRRTAARLQEDDNFLGYERQKRGNSHPPNEASD
ncbi:MAG: hypothetical protein WBE21_09435 [Candidatus Acidiferrales bacterium]